MRIQLSQISYYTDPETALKVELVASKTRRSKSALVDIAVKAFLSRIERKKMKSVR